MGQAKLRGLLAFSVILVLGSAPGWMNPARPDRPFQGGAPERVSGKSDQPAAKEEKSDCDDCVLVRREGAGVPDGTSAESSGMSGASALAGTLWGLFMVARPKRKPRTIIRGITIP